jgi:hypothetical protein
MMSRENMSHFRRWSKSPRGCGGEESREEIFFTGLQPFTSVRVGVRFALAWPRTPHRCLSKMPCRE